MMKSVSGCLGLAIFRNSSPSIIGIVMSRKTKSGSNASRRDTASLPFVAEPTNWQ